MLPLVDEIRAARARVAEAQRAALDLAEVDGAVGALDVARRVRGATSPPDDELCDRVAAAWGLPPRPSREALLTDAQRHLRPRARAMMRLVEEMLELQRRQQEAMTEEVHREIAERVAQAVRARDHLAHELVPLEQQLAVIEPSITTLATFVGRVREAEAVAASGEDPKGIAAWRAAAMAATLLQSLDALVREVALDLSVPSLPMPDEAGPGRASDHRVAAARGREALEGLLGALVDSFARLRETAAAPKAERERLDAWLLEQLG